jgi:HTH-type transcriptional regulator/antitoxin HigA
VTRDIKPIKTDDDYQAALKDIESLVMAEPDTEDGEKLDVMVTLIQDYEAKHFAMELPNPIKANKFEMEHTGLTVRVIVCMRFLTTNVLLHRE